MKLAPEQVTAYDSILKWVTEPDKPFFILKGFAGTGKTVLLSEIIRNYMGDDLFCCAPTAKAASVLMGKLDGKIVTTIHALLYRPVPPSNARVLELKDAHESEPDDADIKQEYEEELAAFKRKEIMFEFEGGALSGTNSFIVVDEASMVSNNIMQDLINLGCRVLFVGDDGQLPPVKSADWFEQADADARLTEVHRQALESPIIRLSMDIRNGSLRSSQYLSDDCRILPKAQVKISELMLCDQIITGRNMERHKLNRLIRKKMKRDSNSPVEGDKLICVKNAMNSPEAIYVNGAQAVATSDAETLNPMSGLIDMDYDGIPLKQVHYYRYHTEQTYGVGDEALDWRDIANLKQFDYAYAITCHKSQGSEWNNVIVIDDRMQAHDKAFRKRWLYTAVTRAKQKLTLVQ